METYEYRCYKVTVFDEVGIETSVYKVRIFYFGTFLLNQLRNKHTVYVHGIESVMSSDKNFKFAEFLPF